MSPPNDPGGHEGTPRHGLHDDAEHTDVEEEGSYVDSELGDDEDSDHHEDEEGTYVDVDEGAGLDHHHPDHGHYVDRDREDEPPEDD